MKLKTFMLTALMLVCLPLIASCGNSVTGAQPAATLPPVLDLADVTAEGRLEPVRQATISPATGGLVGEVMLKEGDPVHAGDLIARIQDTQAQSLEAAQTNAAQELTAAYEAVREAQKELDAYPLPRVFVGMTAEQAARTWLSNLDTARVNFAPYAESSRRSYKWNRRLAGLPPRVLMDTGAYEGMAKEYKKQVDIGWVYYRRACAWLDLESQLETAKARLAQAQRTNDDLQDASFSPSSAEHAVLSRMPISELRSTGRSPAWISKRASTLKLEIRSRRSATSRAGW